MSWRAFFLLDLERKNLEAYWLTIILPSPPLFRTGPLTTVLQSLWLLDAG